MRFFSASFVLCLCFLSCQSKTPTVVTAFPIAADTIAVIAEVKDMPTPPDYDTLHWTEINKLIPDLTLDLRYATENNFVGEQMYDCARAFLRPKAATALATAAAELRKQGLYLKILDAYRPRPVQQRLWDKVPDRRYVTPPAKGSMHNRGAAVDLTLTDAAGKQLDMGTDYDYFGKEAWPEYRNLPPEVLKNRQTLRTAMLNAGFRPTRTEWWHFSINGTGFGLSDWEWECL